MAAYRLPFSDFFTMRSRLLTVGSVSCSWTLTRVATFSSPALSAPATGLTGFVSMICIMMMYLSDMLP